MLQTQRILFVCLDAAKYFWLYYADFELYINELLHAETNWNVDHTALWRFWCLCFNGQNIGRYLWCRRQSSNNFHHDGRLISADNHQKLPAPPLYKNTSGTIVYIPKEQQSTKFKVLPNDFAIFDYSIVGHMLGRTPDHADPQETEPLHKEEENTQDDEEEEKEPEEEATFCSSILSVDYVFSVIWYLILCVRMSSWFAWIQTWSETLQLSPTEMTEFQYIKVRNLNPFFGFIV